MKKTQIELACFEEDLSSSLHEVRTLMKSLEIQVMSLKVKVRQNNGVPASESWIQVTLDSYPPDVQEIYNLKKQQRQQEGCCQILADIKKIMYSERTEIEKLNDILKFFPVK